jgi:formiminoglutamase
MSHFTFHKAEKNWLTERTSKRPFETKIGEIISVDVNENSRYGILGICEDIGPQANLGNPGSTNAFDAFLMKFLNMQSNRFLSGENCVLIGKIIQNISFESVEKSREIISELDDLVSQQISKILQDGLIPIVIGGGHNNAFPIIRSVSEYTKKPIHVINCDPHADFRPLEGRHSGNPFSTAFEEGFLQKYSVLGLHKAYNSENMLQQLEQNQCAFTFFDDYVTGKSSFKNDVLQTKEESTFVGLELDLDSIKDMPSSAKTPSGFSLEEARFYISTFAQNSFYLHLPEAAPITDNERNQVGKALAYLVSDFISA